MNLPFCSTAAAAIAVEHAIRDVDDSRQLPQSFSRSQGKL